jgi:hypothetical protein
MRRLPDDFDGNKSPYVFTWSDELPNKTWGMGSGCAPFYNTAKTTDSNTTMKRYFDTDSFEIFAVRKYQAGRIGSLAKEYKLTTYSCLLYSNDHRRCREG